MREAEPAALGKNRLYHKQPQSTIWHSGEREMTPSFPLIDRNLVWICLCLCVLAGLDVWIFSNGMFP